MAKKIMTAESVTAGHPDKLADLISDSILDECLRVDPRSRVACEVMLTGEEVIIAGEITCKGFVDYKETALNAISNTGYPTHNLNFRLLVHEQSPDIAQAVDGNEDQGAGDQGKATHMAMYVILYAKCFLFVAMSPTSVNLAISISFLFKNIYKLFVNFSINC